MSRDSGAGAYSQGIAWPSPMPHEDGAGASRGAARDGAGRCSRGPLWHGLPGLPASRAPGGLGIAPRPARLRCPAMRRLAGVHEFLDGPLDDPAVLRGNLRDLARINRWLGGVGGARDGRWSALTGRRTVPHTLLDVGTGAADIPLALIADGAKRGRAPARDRDGSRQEVVEAALALDPRLATIDGLELGCPTGGRSPGPTGRSTSSTPRSSSITWSRATRSRSCGRPAGSPGSASSSTTSSARAAHWLGARLLVLA